MLKQLQERDRYIQELLQSGSWRITRPVRWLHRRLFSPSHARTVPAQAAAPGPKEGTSTAAEEAGTPALPEDARKKWLEMAALKLEIFLECGGRLQFPEVRSEPVVSVLVVLFNRAELTLECLSSLLECGSRDFEVVIVDNHSSDSTARLLERVDGAKIVRNTANVGFLAGANQAAGPANGEFLLFLNNDARVLPGSIVSAIRTARSDERIGAVGGKLICPDGALQEAGSVVWNDGASAGYGRGDRPFEPQYMFQRDVDYCSGAFLLTRSKLFRDLGGFDPVYRPAYYEEADYCFRLRRHGYRVVYDPSATVLHFEFGGTTELAESIELQKSHRAIFASRFGEELKGQQAAGSPAGADLRARMRQKEGRRVLLIDDRVPHPHLGSGFPRALALVSALVELDSFVTLYPLGTPREDWDRVYADLPREVEVMIGRGAVGLVDFLTERSGFYDTLLVSRPHNMELIQRVHRQHPGCFAGMRILYDPEAVYVMREVELGKVEGRPSCEADMQKRIEKETALASIADTIFCVSEKEKEIFEQRQHGQRVEVLRHAIAPDPTRNGFAVRTGFLFVGAIHGDATPNADSVCWFVQHVLPRISAGIGQPAHLTVAGLNLSRAVSALACEHVIITGPLDDLGALYEQARVFVAPTRFAAGVPLKIYESAARGLPVVATGLLAEQLGWEPGRELLVGQTADSFAEECVRLYLQQAKWEELRTAALQRVTAECSKQSFLSTLRSVLVPGR